MLSIAYKGIGIPLYWHLLDKRGNSKTFERKALLNKFIHNFGVDKIKYVLADREFVGKVWFTWLQEEGVPFCIRIKKNSIVTNRRGQRVQIHTLLRQANQNETFLSAHTLTVDGCDVRIFARRNSKNELMIVATNDFNCFDGISLYSKRWEVETLFSCFKGRGFNLENTHITDMNKMKKLVAVFAIAFCWCYKIGIKENEEKPIKRKNHGRLSKSLFRLGLDIFQEIMRKVFIINEIDSLNELLDFLDLNTSISYPYIE